MSQKECCDTKKTWCNFLILNDSTCQFYYKVYTCVRPYKKSGRGVTCIGQFVSNLNGSYHSNTGLQVFHNLNGSVI